MLRAAKLSVDNVVTAHIDLSGEKKIQQQVCAGLRLCHSFKRQSVTCHFKVLSTNKVVPLYTSFARASYNRF